MKNQWSYLKKVFHNINTTISEHQHNYRMMLKAGIYPIDKEDENVTVVKRLSLKASLLLAVAVIAFSLIMGTIMTNLPGSQDSYLEAFATAMGMVNGVLLMLRYSEHWYAWVITTALYLIMDISAGAYGLLIDDIAMMVVTFYGIYKWFTYTRKHGTIQEKFTFRNI